MRRLRFPANHVNYHIHKSVWMQGTVIQYSTESSSVFQVLHDINVSSINWLDHLFAGWFCYCRCTFVYEASPLQPEMRRKCKTLTLNVLHRRKQRLTFHETCPKRAHHFHTLSYYMYTWCREYQKVWDWKHQESEKTFQKICVHIMLYTAMHMVCRGNLGVCKLWFCCVHTQTCQMDVHGQYRKVHTWYTTQQTRNQRMPESSSIFHHLLIKLCMQNEIQICVRWQYITYWINEGTQRYNTGFWFDLLFKLHFTSIKAHKWFMTMKPCL